MGFCSTSTVPQTSLSNSQSSTFFTYLKPCPILSSTYLRPKRLKFRLRINATATIDSPNGAVAVVEPEKQPEKISFGRQYFPLAAVIGQVSFPFLRFLNYDNTFDLFLTV